MSLSNPNHSQSNSIFKLLKRLPKNRFLRELERKQTWLAISLLFVGLLITLIISLIVKSEVESVAKSEFGFACEEIENKITTRLHAHAQLLRSLSTLFEIDGGVTREEWRNAYFHQMIDKNLPGIQGVGYSIIIPQNQLAAHQKKIRNEGFPNYSVKPEGNREIYTAIIYLEPFSGRNLRAFGYDMFSEPIRRMAMEKARDFNVASLTKKIILVQETDADIQVGTLMYLPVYKKEMTVETVEERRSNIIGWVYSPYRMDDLMKGILGGYENISEKSINIEIYDNASYNQTELLYDSKRALEKKTTSSPLLSLKKSISFNDHQWYLQFTQYHSPTSNFDYSKVWYTAIGGASVSLLIFVLYLSLISSIRANKLTEELARELSYSEKKFRNLIENSHDVIYTLTPDGIFTFVSPSWTILLGHPVKQVIGKSLQKFVHPDDFPLCLVWLKKVIESGERQEGVEYRVQHNDGTWYWHTSSAVPLADEAGTSIGFEGIARDITERKNAEEIMKKLHEELQILLDNIPAWVFFKDTENRFIRVNKTFANAMGTSIEQLERKSLFDLFPIEQAEVYWKDDKEVFTSGKPKINIIEQMESPNGNIWVQTDKIPYRNLQGEIAGIIGFAIDITARKAAEDKIQKVNEELKELNLTKDKFFSIIAHDLKSPFQGFLGLTQIMAEEANSFSADELTKLGTEMHQTADNLFALLKNLLEWAQMQNGSMSFEPNEVSLSELIAESIKAIKKRSKQKGITIINMVTYHKFALVDDNMINSVLLNLLSNAVKFTKRFGTITIQVKSTGNKMIEISVSDTGVGIPKDKIQKLFKAGEKIGTKGTEGELSTGLGLLLCKEFVEKHGGKIWAESEENKGSTFYFTVPEGVA